MLLRTTAVLTIRLYQAINGSTGISRSHDSAALAAIQEACRVPNQVGICLPNRNPQS
jgi:hypothetical protein